MILTGTEYQKYQNLRVGAARCRFGCTMLDLAKNRYEWSLEGVDRENNVNLGGRRQKPAMGPHVPIELKFGMMDRYWV
jgi:hypothetical protein